MWLVICSALSGIILWQWQTIRRLRNLVGHSDVNNQDQLTGLYHRHQLITLAEHEINRAQRNNSKVSAIIVDLDHCSKINHQYGHQAGDLALQHIANAARASTRDFDLIGRFSGEEIVLVLPNTDAAGALVVAERLRHKVKQSTIALQNQPELLVTVTMGLATLHSETQTIDDLLLDADTALQTAMQSGIDHVHAFNTEAATAV